MVFVASLAMRNLESSQMTEKNLTHTQHDRDPNQNFLAKPRLLSHLLVLTHSSMPAKKYIFENGVMKLNPEYTKENSSSQTQSSPPLATQDQPLAIISSMNDVGDATTAQMAATGQAMQLAPSTVASLDIIQDDDYSSQFHGSGLDGSDLLDHLTNYFIQYEIPVGMLNKLMALQFYNLYFLIDDSGSMRAPTDSMMSEASIYLLRNGLTANPQQPMTRWQEAENRLHVMMDILAFVPTKQIVISFFNAPNVITIARTSLTPESFKTLAHDQIIHAFSTIDVRYKTPTKRILLRSFSMATTQPDPTMHYLFTDGVPTDASVEEISSIISNRSNPQANPLTLISCTNEDDEVEWMKEIEEKAPYTAELDDYHDEKTEVLEDQGKAFPYTKGYWIISQLVAAINPEDLDAIDENLPFTKATLDNLLGRVHTPQVFLSLCPPSHLMSLTRSLSHSVCLSLSGVSILLREQSPRTGVLGLLLTIPSRAVLRSTDRPSPRAAPTREWGWLRRWQATSNRSSET
jgi:hypothetical protein